jgi:hypothetical protein
MRDRLKNSHPFSFSKDWPDNVILGNLSYGWTNYKNPDNPNRTHGITWIPMDTEENYNKLKKEGYYSLNKSVVENFKYEVNSNGFRCDNFDTIDFSKKSIVYLGCSHTFGIGSPEEDIWCSMLHKLLQEHYNIKFNFINLGVPGGSIDDCLRFIPYFKKFNPHMIISCNPTLHRMIIPHDSEQSVGYYSAGCVRTPENRGYHELLKHSDEYFIYKYNMTLQVVKSVSDAMNIEFYESNILSDNWLEHFSGVEEKLGNIHNRDGAHYNRKIHDIVTSFYFKMITERTERKL